MILSIDTSASQILLALYDAEKNKLAAELMLDTPLTHGATLMPGVEFLLKQFPGAKLSALGVCVGPGSFTGLRVGLATAQGLAFALNVPVVGLSSLEVLAASQGERPHIVWVVMDARQKMLYAAPFTWASGRLVRLAADGAANVERLKELITTPACLLGSGASLYAQEFISPGVEVLSDFKLPTGRVLAQLTNHYLELGKSVPPEQLKPNYCRPSEAEASFKLPLENYNLL